ncbi:hypothetical protein EMIHUDRAFT_230216 [Emiliania huxleyi CCMP1516]|uniref:Pseudouridine synthase RsuA/RluA-like domain-containing protein n=2 Tax=Emiliania huxleyi TaxID=2903 RepID=A0A0D3KAR5_EMIH1|nr:hypothetical protein EMIHUDRAFT_230216 [Emiliania huxleyi CCMP1516]EOD32850.1 hypothetical protein EMIHUDRAFT_230216 [Emiliania huxleyi CCMP1516]|eukprot:XP_005785279.1 hypothetical protein EMIHUDRAFT_230216 [Emiliania huxleyi CCMP1516]
MSSDPKPVGGQWHKAARGELSPPKGASEETLVPQLFTASGSATTSKSSKRRHLRKLGLAATPPAPPPEASVPATASASAADKPSRTIRRRALKQRAAQAKRAAAEKPKPKPKPRRAESSRSGSLPVLHEDQHVIAVDKPAGMLSHASEGDSSASLVDALAGRQVVAGHSPLSEEMLMPRLAPTGEPDSHIPRCVVHRLDRGTSGALLLAKTPQAEAALGAAFRSRTTAKRYIALLSGRPNPPRPVGGASARERPEAEGGGIAVEAPLGRDAARPGRSVVDAAGGKPASSAGGPAFRASLGVLAGVRRGRPLLHAWSMSVPHPAPAAPPLQVRAPLPPDMAALVERLWPELGLDPAAWPQLSLSQLETLEARAM